MIRINIEQRYSFSLVLALDFGDNLFFFSLDQQHDANDK